MPLTDAQTSNDSFRPPVIQTFILRPESRVGLIRCGSVSFSDWFSSSLETSDEFTMAAQEDIVKKAKEHWDQSGLCFRTQFNKDSTEKVQTAKGVSRSVNDVIISGQIIAEIWLKMHILDRKSTSEPSQRCKS